jgi:hypothetical protein
MKSLSTTETGRIPRRVHQSTPVKRLKLSWRKKHESYKTSKLIKPSLYSIQEQNIASLEAGTDKTTSCLLDPSNQKEGHFVDD